MQRGSHREAAQRREWNFRTEFSRRSVALWLHYPHPASVCHDYSLALFSNTWDFHWSSATWLFFVSTHLCVGSDLVVFARTWDSPKMPPVPSYLRTFDIIHHPTDSSRPCDAPRCVQGHLTMVDQNLGGPTSVLRSGGADGRGKSWSPGRVAEHRGHSENPAKDVQRITSVHSARRLPFESRAP